ncbi:Os01g0838500 [Oryza sativa Japonica Group]|uniref:Os01g0838500 protein n=1 Tax=Oryza sativa subsp. japonica TaxID=39947 RepID=A0A0P0VA64_ORYSJ|nr:Os01g0838500 [Oryza sativa Japonica Group]
MQTRCHCTEQRSAYWCGSSQSSGRRLLRMPPVPTAEREQYDRSPSPQPLLYRLLPHLPHHYRLCDSHPPTLPHTQKKKKNPQSGYQLLPPRLESSLLGRVDVDNEEGKDTMERRMIGMEVVRWRGGGQRAFDSGASRVKTTKHGARQGCAR